jgi:hypothetical protein
MKFLNYLKNSTNHNNFINLNKYKKKAANQLEIHLLDKALNRSQMIKDKFLIIMINFYK